MKLENKILIEEKLQVDLQRLEKYWDQEIDKATEALQQEQDRLSQKQSIELAQSNAEAIAKLEKPRPTAQMLNLKKVIEECSKQSKYMLASVLHSEVKTMENGVNSKLEAEKSKKIALFQAVILKRHEAENRTMRLRASARLEALKNKKEAEIKKLLQKYKNMQNAMDNVFEINKVRTERTASLKKGNKKIGISLYGSSISTSARSRKNTEQKYFY